MADLHPCAATACNVRVPRHQLMCPTDWARVPKDLQDAVYSAYRRRPIDGWGPWIAARDAAVAAIDAAPTLFDSTETGGVDG